MKKILLGFTLLASLTSFAKPAPDMDSPEFDQMMEESIHAASFKADLSTCDSEATLKSLFDSQSIESVIGCDEAIASAQTHMSIEDIEYILTEHVQELKMIQIFISKVRSAEKPEELRQDVIILLDNMIDHMKVENNSNLSVEESVFITAAFLHAQYGL